MVKSVLFSLRIYVNGKTLLLTITTDVHGSFGLGGTPLISSCTRITVDFAAIVTCVVDRTKRKSVVMSKVQLIFLRSLHP